KIKDYVINTILKVYLKDNSKARVLSSGMEYVNINDGQKATNSQEWFMKHVIKKSQKFTKK
ncbi:MAG: hypothetical protein Q8Q47_10310, partial [Ignavibacteriaceae bacterium]|nr:hypothetical protein [Ignavibacteriaceae bacterium]